MVGLPILAAALAALVFAAKLPLEIPSDGVYGVYVDTRGNEVHQWLTDSCEVPGGSGRMATLAGVPKNEAPELCPRRMLVHARLRVEQHQVRPIHNKVKPCQSMFKLLSLS